MAVLVHTNNQAAKMQELLREKGIKSILHTEKSVFETGEAREMRLFLEGVLEPGRGHYLNTALTARLIDLKPEDIGPDEETRASSDRKDSSSFLHGGRSGRGRDSWRCSAAS